MADSFERIFLPETTNGTTFVAWSWTADNEQHLEYENLVLKGDFSGVQLPEYRLSIWNPVLLWTVMSSAVQGYVSENSAHLSCQCRFVQRKQAPVETVSRPYLQAPQEPPLAGHSDTDYRWSTCAVFSSRGSIHSATGRTEAHLFR